MDENKCLVGELRRYLSSANYTSQAHESEQVQALKRDLNLAARVGQQLLMQLQSAEHSREATEQELVKLKLRNAKLTEENHQLAGEHDVMAESLSQQEADIAALTAQLKDAQAKADRLRRATAAAKALEREVQMLEQMQTDLHAELERRTLQHEEAQKLAKTLAANLAQHVASGYEDLKRDVGYTGDAPSLTMDSASATAGDSSATSAHSVAQIANPNIADSSIDSVRIELDAEFSIQPRDTATPLKPRQVPRKETKPAPERLSPQFGLPRVRRSRSHESVLSFVPPAVPAAAPVMVSSASRLESTAAPKAVTAVSDQYSLAVNVPPESSAPAPTARDRLYQMRAHQTAIPDRRRWAFTPFRALH